MRQVPPYQPHERSALSSAAQASDFFPLLIGRGRLARHLHHYFHLIDFQHKHYDWPIRNALAANAIEQAELDRKLIATNTIWIMVSDQAILSVFENIKTRMRQLDLDLSKYHFVHSSAANEIQGMSTLHPLMGFGETLYSREQYEAIPFANFSDENTSAPYTLPNPHFSIPNSQRAFYHSCAVMMSNLPIMLWSEVSKTFEVKLGTSPEVFQPILKQTLQNFIEQGAKALTGPIARGDQATISKNIAAIESSPLASIYKAFTQLNPGAS